MPQKCFKYILNRDYANLSDFLNHFFLGKTKIYNLLQQKKIRINHKEANSLASLYVGDIVEIDFEMKLNTEKINKALEILFEDENVLIINKPIGLLIHSDGNNGEYLDNYVAAYLPDQDPMHVHRLDMDTTGIVLYAKDPLSLSFFSHELSFHNIKREYLAICSGNFSKNSGTVNKAIGTHRHINGKMVIYPKGKQAVTHYIVEKQTRKWALVRLSLENGRTHQIRVHMASIGHPLLNDTLYGGPKLGGRIALHSTAITYYNPHKNKVEHITCNLPKDLVKYITTNM